MTSRDPSMRYLFRPRGVAVVGASHNEAKIGYRLVQNIVAGGYTGVLYPVNPRGGEILGVPVYKSIEEVDGVLDTAYVAVPANMVFDAVKSCARRKAKFAVIITSGFSEVGNSAEEKRIVSYARDHGMRIVGPNVFGIYSSSVSLNATFGPRKVRPGSVAIVTQSGAIGVAMIGKTKVENIGLSAIISVGNKSDVTEAGLLQYLLKDRLSKVILMYIEGIRAGEELVSVLKVATRKKPVIVIKSGRSERGARAAASHTGSLAGEDRVFDDVIRQCGVIRAESLQEALDWCKFLADTTTPRGENATIITNGGGLGVLTADACEKYGVRLYDDVQDLRRTFSKIIPSFGSAKNPIDITGQGTAEDYDRALGAALRNPRIHAVACVGCQVGDFDARTFSDMAERRHSDYKSVKPIVFSLFGGENVESSIVWLKNKDIPVFADVYEATSFLGAVYAHYRNKARSAGVIEQADIDASRVQSVVDKAKAEGRTFLLAHEAREVMLAAGILMPQSRIARKLDEAIEYAEQIGYPVAMKVVSKDIVHKSDIGGVALHLDDEAEVIDAYEAILQNCRAQRPGARIEGIEVCEMVEAGVETIVGARRDSSFGPIVMFGLGGIYVEVLKDISFRAFPLTRQEAMNMISEVHSYALLLGVRGASKKDIDAVESTIIKVGTLLQECGDITDIEINPLAVHDYGQGVEAMDVRILLSKPEEAT